MKFQIYLVTFIVFSLNSLHLVYSLQEEELEYDQNGGTGNGGDQPVEYKQQQSYSSEEHKEEEEPKHIQVHQPKQSKKWNKGGHQSQ